MGKEKRFFVILAFCQNHFALRVGNYELCINELPVLKGEEAGEILRWGDLCC